MKMIFSLLWCFALVGCSQETKIEEVENRHNDIQNLEGLDRFVMDVENQNEAIINYIQYGIEGQRGVRTLTFDGEQISVSHSVDGDFIEEFNCEKIIVETEEEIQNIFSANVQGILSGISSYYQFQVNETNGYDNGNYVKERSPILCGIGLLYIITVAFLQVN